MGRTVVVWRSLLLPASETFVRHHGAALATWRAAYVGAVKVPSHLAADDDVIALRRAGWLWLRLTGRSRRLRAALAAQRPAVVHAHFGGDAWLVSGEAARLGVPLVVTLHGLDVTAQAAAPGWRGRRHRRHLRAVFRRAAAVLAVSEPIRGRAVALGADPARVRVHHTGVPLPPAPEPVAPAWDVAFVGRFVAKKGVADLIEALGTLPGVRAVLIGDGPLLAAARERAAALGVDATFTGALDPAGVRRHVAAARVLAAPSRTAPDGDTEGLPTTILEAAALGVPAVTTVHSGIPEAVVDGETGLLSAEGDHAALAVHIGKLLADDALRARLGRQARRHAEAHFDLARQSRALEALYEAVS
ncbi:glycosyltransferase [Spirilliplanes yamanashiensis]|uniref:Glycosyl transferase family 1 n=1 Tax=Spirilliplanes yamanashiensis TaxID=42233 RepID=A0A8J4DI25_9ACTN|nr:glycosyltransferase [Spirilliplanes yamanashiensis]MDP9819198.1 glycosyltransferase involved in cell wall biosynthesis [Spirilliplanes yamanashiensis]GIJ01979.1 glycosyl transferase family 1 [Spirilliplanes yamanashiensis]